MSIVTAGLDLSMASTGLAVAVDGRLAEVANIKSSGKKGDTHREHMPRIKAMAEQINDWLADKAAAYGGFDLAAIEAPSFNSRFGNPHERAGIFWRVYEQLWLAEVRIETLAPASRAKYITGNGKADKTLVLACALEKWDEEGELISNHDIADATGLAMWGWEEAVV